MEIDDPRRIRDGVPLERQNLGTLGGHAKIPNLTPRLVPAYFPFEVSAWTGRSGKPMPVMILAPAVS